MLTVARVLPPNSHPEESSRERLTFIMSRESIEQVCKRARDIVDLHMSCFQLTGHIVEFIRCQKLVYKLSIR